MKEYTVIATLQVTAIVEEHVAIDALKNEDLEELKRQLNRELREDGIGFDDAICTGLQVHVLEKEEV